MRKLTLIALCILLLTGCAATYDGPTVEKPVLSEYTSQHYSSFFGSTDMLYSTRATYAYDIYGNMVRTQVYRDGELESVTNLRYDDRGNYICKELFKNGQPIQRYEARYDEQNRQIGYGWYDSDGNLTFQSESLYDELGRKTGIVEYEDGTLVTTTELRYDDQNRKIWGETHDADGRLTNHWEYIYDDSAHSKTCISGDSITSVEYYHPSGQIEKLENYDRDGNLTSRSVYTYTEIQIPAKEE